MHDGDRTTSIGGRDPVFAAYLAFLDDDADRMARVVEQARDELGAEQADVKKTTVVRLLLRVGLQEAAPDEWDLLREANAEYARRNP